jgi:hypothetical protein
MEVITVTVHTCGGCKAESNILSTCSRYERRARTSSYQLAHSKLFETSTSYSKNQPLRFRRSFGPNAKHDSLD